MAVLPQQNKLELAREWAAPEGRAARFTEVYSYITMLRGCHIAWDYQPIAELASAFALTPAGEEVLNFLADELPHVDEHSRRLGVAVYFAHQDLFVDVEQTNLEAVHAGLANEMANGTIRFPQEYGRFLYDRFFDAFPSRTTALSYEETQVLVGDAPTAPYQMGFLTVGPLGPAKSASFRLFAPSHNAPLWHCSDPGCSALHTVQLGSAPAGVNEAWSRIQRRAAETRVAPSEWDGLFRVLSGQDRGYYGDSSMPKLPWLLADAFSSRELRELVGTAFELEPLSTREALAPYMDVNRRPADIATELDEQTALQCLLLLDDRLVGRSIESAVLKGRVHVPATESRRAIAFKSGGGTWWRLAPEVGALGLRSVSNRPDFALLRLQKLLLHLGTSPDVPASLDWELRFAPGLSLIDKLSGAMQQEPPRELLRRFVMSSAEALNAAVEYLQPMFFEIPTNEHEEALLLDRLLWKLGFAVAQHPPELATFWRRAEGMRAAAGSGSGRYSAQEQDPLRSVAVNYFISLEDLFDRVLCFTGWALLNDHYAAVEAKQFSFSLEDARIFIADRLNAAGSAEPLRPDAHNTLWPLVYNFSFLGSYLRSVLSDADNDARSSSDLPEFFRAGAAPFPFQHRTPVHDLNPASVEQIAQLLCDTSAGLTKIDLPNLRNRLEHKRPDADFPTAEEVRLGLERVSEAVTLMETAGLLPVLHVFDSEAKDQYDRTYTVLRDYAGRALKIAGPTGSRHGRMPALSVPQVPFQAARLREIPDVLRFTLSEASEYRRKWENYPRRRLRVGVAPDEAAAAPKHLDLK